MKNKKDQFNNYILRSIMKHSKYEPFNVIEQLKEYISTYPNDCAGYMHYARMLIDVGSFDEAKQMLDFIDSNFPEFNTCEIEYYKLRYLMFTHQYVEAKELFDKYKNELLERDPKNESFEVVYDSITNKNLKRDYNNRYLINQIIDYRYDDFLNHIKKHMADYNIDVVEPNSAIFASDFPIEEVVFEIKNYIPGDKKILFSYYNDFYTFKYDNNGRIDNKVVDYIRVVTIHDTADFITMYPLDSGANLPYIDLNYMKEEKEVKVKKLSRVDKFNQKYGFNK